MSPCCGRSSMKRRLRVNGAAEEHWQLCFSRCCKVSGGWCEH